MLPCKYDLKDRMLNFGQNFVGGLEDFNDPLEIIA